MKNIFLKISLFCVVITALITVEGCKKDYIDPRKATEDQVFSSPVGLTGVVVGLQRVYTAGRASSEYNSITINGLVTNELFVVNTGNTAEVQLQTGGTSVDPTHTMLATYWTSNNKIIYDADLVLANAPNLADKNYASGLIAYASIFKALSIGNMAMYWEFVPAGTGLNVTFISRVDGFKKAVQVLNDAITAIAANPVSAGFISSVPAGIDISNTLQALKARYSLFAGDLPAALTAANAVDLTKKSTFNFDALTLNPVFEVATSTNNVVQVIDSTLGLLVPLQPALNDGRVPFYTSINPTIAPRFRINGFGAGAATQIPVYLPGEMTLIKAEVYARQNDSTTSKTFLNAVLTKTTDPFGVNANQPAIINVGSYANLLDQIYRNRCIELYMSGMKLEDMRRFGRPTSERKRNLMPYPFRERDNNPNTPADPPF
jgi:hypothetical protein